MFKKIFGVFLSLLVAFAAVVTAVAQTDSSEKNLSEGGLSTKISLAAKAQAEGAVVSGEGEEVSNPDGDVTLSSVSATIGVGETYNFAAKLTSGRDETPVYASSDSTVASVDGKSGVVTAKSVGTAQVTATYSDGAKELCNVTVKKAPTSVILNKTKITVGVGETFDFNSTVPSGEGTRTIKYTSSNKSVASVKAAGGLMTAKKAGTTVITATAYNGVKATCTVTVKSAPTSLSLNKTKMTVGVGETFDFNSSLKSGQGSYSIKYSSSNSTVASVKEAGGLMTAKEVGTAVITATTYNGVKASCTVTVKTAPTEVIINKTKITVGVGETFDFNSTVPSGQGTRTIDYSSSDSTVASVKKAGGLMTAKKVGTAVIAATAFNGVKATCTVTVKKAPTSLSLNKTKITVGVGETFDFNSSLKSGQGSYSIKYSTSKSSVASVKQAGGLMTAKAAGTAVITATTYNGVTATCTVTVKKAPTEVKLNQTSLTMIVGETFDLNASFNSGEGAYKISYSSNNSSVASVASGGGLVTAKQLGSATVTATTYNGKKVTCSVNVIEPTETVKTVAKTPLKDTSAWAGETLATVPKGTELTMIVKTDRWYKVVYNGEIGYIYNRAVSDVANYSSVTKSTLPAVIDDWFFKNGTDISTIYSYARNVSYVSVAKGASIEDMCVRVIKYHSGACYHHAAILYYMLDRAGYEVLYVEGVDYYTGGGPHAWNMVKTSSGWRHIDATTITGLPKFYLVKDSAVSPYFGWDKTKYPKAV